MHNQSPNGEETQAQFMASELINYAQKLVKELIVDAHDAMKATKEQAELETALRELKMQASHEMRKEGLKSIQRAFAEPAAFACLLVHYPLDAGGMTFTKLRSTFREILVSQQLLLATGGYNESFIQAQTSDQLKQMVQNASLQVKAQFGTASTKIMHKMAADVQERLLVIHSQIQMRTLSSTETCWHEGVLTAFLTETARLLNHEIEVQFYTQSDGNKAYTQRNDKIVFFNRLVYLQEFSKIFSADTKVCLEQDAYSKLAAHMAETVAHELVHQEESHDCHTTHDQLFKEQLAKKLERLFCRPNGTSPLELLAQACI
jgi:hypothetical protein